MQKIIVFILAESPRLKGGEPLVISKSESAPHYFGLSVPGQVRLGEETHSINNSNVSVEIKAYHPTILLIEAHAQVENIFSSHALELRGKLTQLCRTIINQRGGKFDLSEEYAVGVVSEYEGDPEQFFSHASHIASFLKSERLPLDDKEVEYTMSSQMKYAKDDLVIVDWDGAVVFDPHGEYQSILELLQLANFQLLRYRILDLDLDQRLKKANRIIRSHAQRMTFFKNKELEQAFSDIITIRSKSIAEFGAIEREIKLIGDWYSARLYDLAAKKFKLEIWKSTIKEKLESLEDVYSIVSENFSISRSEFLELVQIILFFVLQAGWFALIILEFIYFTR